MFSQLPGCNLVGMTQPWFFDIVEAVVDCGRRVAHGVAFHAGAREVRQRRDAVGVGAVQLVLHGDRRGSSSTMA
jgi:hypothetical protein